ncbi:pyridine nucleotide-disulfide oxidoreductase [Lachnoclostridium sp. An169]|uniref:FAD-dependent oxidoreductase n=1 Tax=Lachnoclostridium sp. An169 TaxID=1965569 RepID=UPI000B38DC56|nr:FAD-dependent oxidoreductase [Lachnoclostridium sp. An169]OUP81523.1 pyridine nucleotide-disulfide oxidoreductase [Lachnoclostridium sp. An169]HJA67998.1 FAD-dependent oxidoreductase [Candidatus Mediterraneibacter cottocaccae]
MKVLIIGGVAAGTKTAAKLKREDRSAEVTVITRDQDISYAGCGLPYYVGGLIGSRDELIVNTPQKYANLTGVEVRTGKEAVALNAAEKTVTVRDVATGNEEACPYDKLVIAVGASAAELPIPGKDLPGVFKMRTPDDAEGIRNYITENNVKRAVVIGAGFIGLEAAENLQAKGVSVTVIDFASQVLPNILDPEMAAYVKKHLLSKGIRVITGTSAEAVLGTEKVTGLKTSAGTLACEMLIMAAGIRPNTAFLENTGIEMFKGTILVDNTMKTSLDDVYAAGDCVMVTNCITGKRQWSPMGSSANMEGRTLAQVLTGTKKTYPGVLGTGVVKLPGLNIGRTGLTEEQAKEAGYDVITTTVPTDDKAHYYPDASFFITKLIADRTTRKLLGVQVFGPGEVDKMVDIAVMGINMGAVLEDFENADFAYAPPFSTAIHPFVQAVYVLMNKIDGSFVSMTPAEYAAGKAEGYKVVDVAPEPQIRGAFFVNLASVKGEIEGLGKDEKLLLVCARGKRAYFLQNRMRYYGYTNTVVLEGATFLNDVKVKNTDAAVSKEEETRVKALGFLKDKRTPDRFNGRVITRNGKITAEEARVIAEAAEKFGSGEVTMTSRLTMEIQGVPFDNIEPLREYLMQAGLETGGTGSKVRPVVSCKGTTCQYGLIDTFALSEEIHERFYHGYREVKLPHKFKIAVGGCPNNCVKPDLNDLGIIGQRVPQVDLEKCRGCKVCQIENTCPIKVAKLADGKVTIDETACNHCGRCVGKCPFGVIENYTNGYRIYIGGRWGKKVAQGRYLDKVFTDKEEVLSIVEKAILLFREQGITGERFADTVARLGFENVQEQLLSDDLLARKEENIKAQKHLKGGATC